MKERTLINKRYIAYLISNSITTDLDTLLDAKNINCYAAARMLTYPDVYRQYYAPGRIYNLQNGGNFVRNDLDLEFIHHSIMLDSITLNQSYTRVRFEEIDNSDGYHYFGFCKSQIVLPKQVHKKAPAEWHFIFRLPTGIWLHKPGSQSINAIDWIEKGKYFQSKAYSPFVSFSLPVDIICFENMFYRLDNKYELSLPEDDFESFVENL